MISIVGGVYAERCVEPHWDDVYGSAGRAAAAISAAVRPRLVTYRARELADGLDNLQRVYSLELDGPEVATGVSFDYVHSLAVPRITPRPDAIPRHATIDVSDDVVLRFGMLEGDAKVRARRAVYDPQSAFGPVPFKQNGSVADELALILNRLEARCLTGESDPGKAIARLFEMEDAAVIVLKMGGHGALVATKDGITRVPAYRSERVFKIGSGDVFSAAFTLYWAVESREPTEAANLASRATSYYCATRALPLPAVSEIDEIGLQPVQPGSGQVYLASPFFNLAERWIVEEARSLLLDMGVPVFSPLHDVGSGPGYEVAPLDLAGIDASQAVLAILNGADVGTVFEVGYAVARKLPVVALAQNMRSEDLKMVEGTACTVVEDLVSAIYHVVWTL